MGARAFDEAVAESLLGLDRLGEELVRSEALAATLRHCLQSGDRRARGRALHEMERVGLDEADLCAAWHHLPRERRGYITEALRRVDAALLRSAGA
jgi:hypothetical protein